MQATNPTSERIIEQQVEISSTRRCGCDWRIGVVALAALATLTSLFLLPWPVTLSLGLASAVVITWLYLDCCVPSDTLASCNRLFFGIFPSFGTVRTKETIYVEQPRPSSYSSVHRYAEWDVPIPQTDLDRARALHSLQGRQGSSRKRVPIEGQPSVRPPAGSKLAPPSVTQLSVPQPFPPRQPPISLPAGAKFPPSSASSFSTAQPFPPRKRVDCGGEPSLLAPSSASAFHSSSRPTEWSTPPTPIESAREPHPVQGRQDSTRKRVQIEGQSSIRPPAGAKLAPQSVGVTQPRKRVPKGS